MSFALIGCSDCSEVWVIEDDDRQTMECPTCRSTKHRSKRRTIAYADEFEQIAQIRSAVLAERAGYGDADLDHYATQEIRTDEPIVDDRSYLEGVGVDDETVDEIAATDDEGESTTSSTNDRPTADPGTGPDIDVEIADRQQLTGSTADEPRGTGVFVLEPHGQRSLTGFEYRDVPPQTSEWLDDVVADLIPSTARLVQDLARARYDFDYRDPDAGSGAVSTFIHECLVDEVAQLDAADADAAIVEEARAYHDAIGRYALLWADDVYRVRRGFDGAEQFERIEKTLETTGTGRRGQFQAGVEALRHSLVALHAEREETLSLSFILAGEDWTAAEPETLKNALATFDVLGDGFDVRLLMSPGVQNRVRMLVRNALDHDDEAVPSWADRFAYLTDDGTTSRRQQTTDDSAESAQGWDAINDDDLSQGCRRLLAQLDHDEARSTKALKRDDVVDAAANSVDVYTGKLEAKDLIHTDRSHASNRHTLTSLGQSALDYVANDGTLVPPNQSRLLGASYSDPSASHKYSVARQPTGGEPHSPAERWMAETGDPQEDGYVQFLGDSTGVREIEPPVLHRRILAGERVKGVNFVDSDILNWREAENGDGRVTYSSIFDDQALLVTQWGGPAQTLARLCSGLLGNKMMSKALNMDALGEQFERAHDGVNSYENDLHDVFVRAQQIGWLSEDELDHYDAFRERYGDVRSTLLQKVAGLDDLDNGLRSQLFDDLHGLLCSATHLYRAAGIDVSFNIRLPDTQQLQDNESAFEDFLDFMRYTVTKQAGYEDENGFHSWYRMCIEDREQKLKSRSAYDIGSDNTADLTASWILSGPNVSDLKDHVQEAVSKESGRLRERIDEGVEDAAVLDVPMIEVNSHAHIRGLVREVADQKGFREGNRDDLDRLTRCLEAALATDDRGPDPFLVQDALESLESRDRYYDSLDVRSIENALASLPAKQLFPTLPESARRMLSAMFASDEPLDRQDLIEVTSESSYDRHWKTLRAFFLVERTDEGFVAHLEPWWASTNEQRKPFHEDHPNPVQQPPGGHIKQSAPPARPYGVIFEIANETEHFQIPPDRYYELGKRWDEIDWILDELDLECLRPILQAYCDDWFDADDQSYSDPSGVQIGPPSPGQDAEQLQIAEAVAGAD